MRHQVARSWFIGRARFTSLRPNARACNSRLVRCILSAKLAGSSANVDQSGGVSGSAETLV
ncbi:MAG: hypothetical protein H0U76_13080 [Ktedonobacteraceae bacterium]|nr:hypothetical protein [Ktedonobacteraceae bacterium]